VSEFKMFLAILILFLLVTIGIPYYDEYRNGKKIWILEECTYVNSREYDIWLKYGNNHYFVDTYKCPDGSIQEKVYR